MTTRAFEGDVRAALRPYEGKRLFLEPLEGNHGDMLILLGAELVLAPFRENRVDTPERAELIVINGGGGLLAQPWCGDLSNLRRYAQGFPATSLIVLPSSFYWGDADLAGCFAGRTAETILFARELLSLERVKAADLPERVSIGLDHDMAFHLAGTELVERARRVPRGGYVLLVERFDEEQATGKPLRVKNAHGIGRRLPPAVRKFLKNALDHIRSRTSDFQQAALEEVLRIAPDLAGKPVLYQDVSDVTKNTFDEFVRLIAAADGVVTTRMHAAILAGMLGKPTFMKGKEGEYRKLQSVYAHSLASMPHVHLLES